MAGTPTDTIADSRAGAPTSPDADALALQYAALVEGCGLLDRSDRGKLALTGPAPSTSSTGRSPTSC